MRRQGLFYGLLLINIGSYFLLLQWDVPISNQWLTWPTLLFMIGFAFLFHGFWVKYPDHTFVGTLLCGLSAHFHALNFFQTWPSHWGMYTLVISLAFFIRYLQSKRRGLTIAIILLILSLLSFFYQPFLSSFHRVFEAIDQLWPVALMILGVYLLIFKK
ncbi:hypothetical protein [Texcoconibacillus texcoconensis]|uniref:DUF5668 domain-containing protein n=1 Tax=Texcoconibacillus texcoconensis TaxID=1095777 RepID=A0A840QMN6_9BACI|nr:hypothetical protein [Texcoconibacillus texcoconensis]MBB5172652.1 hypothetical protein [Texcoconibacillus texcoconensis]